ncbi:hypothetical protein [Thioalkalivibrio sp. ALJT]|uniref:hypothetical protein n=1 Tax=Thioalkalivibrio sp. ALJT TaxID=1158146 RepID=UPI000362FD63|nr:hypothetical protein [Thioalkalivibrio sp. ALJT]
MIGSSKHLDKIVRHLEHVEDDIRQTQLEHAAHERRTDRFMQITVASLAAVALLNLYFVGELAHEIGVLVRNMDRTLVHLEEIEDRMTGMELHFQQVGENAGRLPIVVDQMTSISARMQEIERDLGGVSGHMHQMSSHVAEMDRNVRFMTHSFRNVNGKLVHIRHNVREMSRVVP